jgi:hypothetical protein
MSCLTLAPVVRADEHVTPCPTYERASDDAVIVDERLIEISGVAASRAQPGVLWVHNDSGDDAVVYAIDVQGRTVAEVVLDGVTAIDCEDIALGPGPDDGDHLYLGDIGDNGRNRETIRIYRFLEPHVQLREDGCVVRITVVPEVIEVTYPDGPRDAETLLVDPVTGDVVVISKDPFRARVYRVPLIGDSAATMEFLVELPWGLITGGDISSEGSAILLRAYWNAQIWPRPNAGEWWKALFSSGCPVPLAMEPQGEAISFTADGAGYLTISEGRQPTLHLYRRPSESASE